jgi:chemotaxis protein methyltransferase CheR
MTKEIDHRLLVRLNDHLAEHIGLSFPADRLPDFSQRIKAAAKEFGMESPDCVNWLLSSSLSEDQIHTLSYHLTIGETYFFRDPRAFEVLEDEVLAKLIKERRVSARYLRAWSAGCCTGEEPYSLAMLFRRLIGDIESWRISILGTDINPRFLKKAKSGVYDPWSFRITSPQIKERFFTHTEKGTYEIAQEVKQMVHFAQMNLVDERIPAGLIISSMDIIFCRNVLMYFHRDQVTRVFKRLHGALSPGGIIVSTPFELSYIPEQLFERLPYKGAVLLKKREANAVAWAEANPSGLVKPSIDQAVKSSTPAAVALPFKYAPPVLTESVGQNKAAGIPVEVTQKAKQLLDSGRYRECSSYLLPLCSGKDGTAALSFILALSYSNGGDLPEALTWIEKSIEQDKVNHCSYLVRATIFQAQGKNQEAMSSLRQALFLEPEFIVAEFYLASMLLQLGKLQESRKRLRGALTLLTQYNDNDLVPESEGMTAGGLTQIIESLLKETAK